MTLAQEKTTKFLEAVESVGFTNTAKIKSEVERLANNPLIQSFLDELSTSVSSRNLLSNQDLEKFHKYGLSVADIDIGRTEQEIGILAAKNQKLKQRSNRVTQQLESAKRYKEKLEAQLYELECQQNINLEENRQLHLALDASKCQFDKAAQRNEKSMSIYFQAMRDVNMDISTLCSTTLNANDDAVLMSNADFDQVMQEEDEFTRHLTSYAKKQFNQASSGIEDLSSSVQDDLPDLTRTMVDAGHAGQDMETRRRLERAMLGFKNRKLRLILAEASVKQAEAVKAFLEEKMSFFISKTQGHKNIHELQKVKEEADVEARYVLFEVLPKLLEKEGNLERSMLLAGDCRQQLAKQKYLTNKQNKVVELLIQQLSRLLIGWMLMQLEFHQHQMLSRRLAHCNTRLGHEVAEVRSRNETSRAANSTLRKPKTPKAVIDNRDAAMLGVYHSLVSKENEDSIFKTFAAAQSAAEKLKEFVLSVTGDQKLSVIPSSLQNLVNSIQECYELNLDSNSDEFILTPPEVHAGQTTLLELLSTIRELAAQELAKVEKKKSFIQLDSDAAAARNLWVNRFLNPKGDYAVFEGQINS